MPRVRPGLERWLSGDPAAAVLAPGARVGLMVHAASVDSRARHALELLDDGGGQVRIARLFAPEHGLHGHEQDMEQVAGQARDARGRPVISLYGDDAASLRPRPEHLAELDALVYDLQDVGSRYYTFVYTLSFLMEAAAERGIPVVVLDRPNPIGGVEVEGAPLDPALSSFVGRFSLPARHGMTTGELALLFNAGSRIGCDLRVVPMEGWRRTMRFGDTGLPWIPPSPNMPTPATALVYPGACLIEGTNLSEGRGTTTPFELAGAPWLDGPALAARLRAAGLPGVLFRPASFRPMFQKHAGRPCAGVQVLVSDPDAFRPLATYLALIGAAREQRPEEFAWRREAYEFERERLAIDLLLGRADLRPRLEAGEPWTELAASYRDAEQEFRDGRRRFLLYD